MDYTLCRTCDQTEAIGLHEPAEECKNCHRPDEHHAFRDGFCHCKTSPARYRFVLDAVGVDEDGEDTGEWIGGHGELPDYLKDYLFCRMCDRPIKSETEEEEGR